MTPRKSKKPWRYTFARFDKLDLGCNLVLREAFVLRSLPLFFLIKSLYINDVTIGTSFASSMPSFAE